MASHSVRFRLTIETENMAAWMMINNTFATPLGGRYDPAVEYWMGVLFQFGTYKEFSNGQQMSPFGAMQFWKQGDLKPVLTLAPKDFAEGDPLWVNVVTRAPKSKNKPPKNDPMNRGHLRALRVTRDPKPGETLPGTLDYYFKPYPGGITFWPESGLRLSMAPNTDRGSRYKFAFESVDGDSIFIEAHKGSKPIKLKPCDEIRVLVSGGLPDGGHSSPPQDP